MNNEEVLLLLTEIAITDKRSIGRPDIAVWSEVLGGEVPLAFARQAALAHFRENPNVWLNPGHIYQRWRDYRRDQIAREDDRMREARQAALDARNVDELGVTSLVESITAEPVTLKYVRRSEQHGLNPLVVPCPWCKATVGRACTNSATKRITNPHPSRVEAVEALNKEETNA